jgi:hypothetical protein
LVSEKLLLLFYLDFYVQLFDGFLISTAHWIRDEEVGPVILGLHLFQGISGRIEEDELYSFSNRLSVYQVMKHWKDLLLN